MTEQRTKTDLDADLMAIRALLGEEGGAEAAQGDSDRAEAAAPPPMPDAPRDDVPQPAASAAADPGLDAAIRGTIDDTPPEAKGDDALHAQIRAAEIAAAQTLERKAGRKRPKLPKPPRLALGRILAPVTRRVVLPVKQRVLSYRPTPRHVALAVLVLLAVLRPWLVLALMLLPVVIVTGLFLALGSDRFWAGVLNLYRRYHARRPARAERLRKRLDAFALRWDAFLDRFPEGSVDALYLPDLNSLQEQQDRHAEALERRFDRLQDELHT